jgi:hypothetical protein
MKRFLSSGTSGTAGAQADDTRPDPARVQDRQRRRGRLLEFLAWRSLGVRFTLSRAKRRAHGRGTGPIKCIAALSSSDENHGAS